MSNYRDDVSETAVISDTLLTRLRSIGEGTAFASDKVIEVLRVLHEETATVSDAVLDRAFTLLQDTAIVSDEVIDARTVRQLVVETARASDVLPYRTVAPVLEATAVVSDDTTHLTRAVLVDAARVSDEVLGRRTTHQLITEAARASDALVWRVRELVDDTAIASDDWISKLHAAVIVDEVARASDAVLDAYMAQVPLLQSTGRASGQVFDRLLAHQLVIETAVAEDEVLQSGAAGQAWTAHEGGWAMSRWAPLDFAGLAVVDGVLYGTNARGVFALDGQTELLTAEIRTGLLDVGRDTTARLDGSYLEYRLDGTAELDVTQTQQGVRETYTYTLPDKPAGELTSNRFVLGRGLRSRHYEFTLRLQGTRGHINDWRLMTAPSTRRL